MKKFDLTYKPYGAKSILIEWPQKIDKEILKDVLEFKKQLQKSYIKEKVEVNHAYNSILVSYVCAIDNIYNVFNQLKSIYSKLFYSEKSHGKLWKIPVCYHLDFGIDLERISKEKNLTIEDIISRHSQSKYLLYFIGFLPGFMYLGGLDKSLYMPRLAEPRLKISKGDVGIAGEQTGVYPSESPGGWNIIGNSPINFFDLSQKVPCFASAGDQIQFYPISKDEHTFITKQIDSDQFELESEVHHD